MATCTRSQAKNSSLWATSLANGGNGTTIASLDWHLLQYPLHAGLQRWVEDLNRLYRTEPALYEADCHAAGFAWIDCTDAAASVLSLLRLGKEPQSMILVVVNFTPVPRYNYRVGAPRSGLWQEILNSDAAAYGGSNQGNLGRVDTSPIPYHGQQQSLHLLLPPLGVVFLKYLGTAAGNDTVL